MGVDLESGQSAESKEEDHQPACLLGTKDQPSKVVNVCGGADVEGVGKCFNDRVVANAPEARRARTSHANSAFEELGFPKGARVVGDC